MAIIKKTWQCDSCDANITVSIKSKEFTENDISNCPICGTPAPYADFDDELEED